MLVKKTLFIIYKKQYYSIDHIYTAENISVILVLKVPYLPIIQHPTTSLPKKFHRSRLPRPRYTYLQPSRIKQTTNDSMFDVHSALPLTSVSIRFNPRLCR